MVVVIESGAPLWREHEPAPGATRETESLCEMADLMEVVEVVLTARWLVEGPPAKAPGGILHECPTEVSARCQRLTIDEHAQEPPQRWDGVVDAVGQCRRSS